MKINKGKSGKYKSELKMIGETRTSDIRERQKRGQKVPKAIAKMR